MQTLSIKERLGILLLIAEGRIDQRDEIRAYAKVLQISEDEVRSALAEMVHMGLVFSNEVDEVN
jgi:ribosome recycling factor